MPLYTHTHTVRAVKTIASRSDSLTRTRLRARLLTPARFPEHFDWRQACARAARGPRLLRESHLRLLSPISPCACSSHLVARDGSACLNNISFKRRRSDAHKTYHCST